MESGDACTTTNVMQVSLRTTTTVANVPLQRQLPFCHSEGVHGGY